MTITPAAITLAVRDSELPSLAWPHSFGDPCCAVAHAVLPTPCIVDGCIIKPCRFRCQPGSPSVPTVYRFNRAWTCHGPERHSAGRGCTAAGGKATLLFGEVERLAASASRRRVEAAVATRVLVEQTGTIDVSRLGDHFSHLEPEEQRGSTSPANRLGPAVTNARNLQGALRSHVACHDRSETRHRGEP
jgi:hypothetical protein